MCLLRGAWLSRHPSCILCITRPYRLHSSYASASSRKPVLPISSSLPFGHSLNHTIKLILYFNIFWDFFVFRFLDTSLRLRLQARPFFLLLNLKFGHCCHGWNGLEVDPQYLLCVWVEVMGRVDAGGPCGEACSKYIVVGAESRKVHYA